MSNELKAQVLLPDDKGFTKAGEQLRNGNLVAFPTETVYGLGAHALDPNAVLSIFKTKARPLSDPLIVHVLSLSDAKSRKLVTLTPRDEKIVGILAEKFWPGPLTMVLKANEDVVPSTITAGTGMIGIRVPNHTIARKILEYSNVPVAAPSANRFGHVSPTSAQHVLDDLGKHDISVLDGGECVCSVGIESTVLQVHGCNGDEKDGKDKLVLFRKGGICERELVDVLKDAGFDKTLEIQIPNKHKAMEEPGDLADAEPPTNGEAAPGQLITHYAPDIETYLVSVNVEEPANAKKQKLPIGVESSVVIDFGGVLHSLKDKALAYRDLSIDQDSKVAATKIFDTLRWSENVEEAKHVLIVDILSLGLQEKETEKTKHLEAVADRMFRAASGKSVSLAQL